MTLRCPSCRGKLWQHTAEQIKLRVHGPITITGPGHVTARCHWCKEPVRIPLTLDTATTETAIAPTFVIPLKSSDE